MRHKHRCPDPFQRSSADLKTLQALYSGVLSHLSGLAGGAPVVIKPESSGLGHEMGLKIGSLGNVENSEPVFDQVPMYDPLWWSSQRLEQLDATVKPAAPPPEVR